MCRREIFNEKLLVSELAKGNEKAFRKLFDTYRNDIYAYSKSLLKNQVLAEEVVQDVFLKIWQHRHGLNPDLSFKSYVFTITRNLVFNLMSKIINNRKMKEEVFYRSQKSYTPIQDGLAEADYDKIKKKAIEQLPPKRKIIYKMSRNEDMGYEEISEKLKISVSTVKGQMSKALATIRDFLEIHTDITFMIVICLYLGT